VVPSGYPVVQTVCLISNVREHTNYTTEWALGDWFCHAHSHQGCPAGGWVLTICVAESATKDLVLPVSYGVNVWTNGAKHGLCSSCFNRSFLAHTWPQFWEAPTYPNPPTALLPTNPPTSLILLTHSSPTSFCIHFHCQSFRPRVFTSITRASNLERAWVAQSFRSVISTWASRVGSLKSTLARRALMWW
jgi:hypothetical protein